MLANFTKALLRIALGMGLAIGLGVIVMLAYRHFTDETSWKEPPRIEDGKFYMHVAHEDGRLFTSTDRYANITIAIIDRVSKRTREYVTIHVVPTGLIRYLGAHGMIVAGAWLPADVLAETDPLHVCIFHHGDSVGCRKIDR